MHSKNINAFRAKVDKLKYSDHYPLRTYLSLDAIGNKLTEIKE